MGFRQVAIANEYPERSYRFTCSVVRSVATTNLSVNSLRLIGLRDENRLRFATENIKENFAPSIAQEILSAIRDSEPVSAQLLKVSYSRERSTPCHDPFVRQYRRHSCVVD